MMPFSNIPFHLFFILKYRKLEKLHAFMSGEEYEVKRIPYYIYVLCLNWSGSVFSNIMYYFWQRSITYKESPCPYKVKALDHFYAAYEPVYPYLGVGIVILMQCYFVVLCKELGYRFYRLSQDIDSEPKIFVTRSRIKY